MVIRFCRLAMSAVPMALAAAGVQPAFGLTFEDTTTESGIASLHHGSYLITGQAWGDYDGDGLEDLYLTDNIGPNTLYRNLGNGTFEISSLNDQVNLPAAFSGGATFADYDNDGDLDLLVVNDGTDNLFENTGSGFVDVTVAAGLTHVGEGESAAWADFNEDGFLDLYIANWWFSTPSDPLGQDRFYLNGGDGTFTEVSDLLNIDRMLGPAFAVTFIDYDNDGDQDLYVVNDKNYGNLLWRNDGAGCGLWCFTDVSAASGAERPAWGMGIAVGDYDLDGDWDFYYSSIGEQILLQSQVAQGSPSFVEVSVSAGVSPDAFGWGSVFVDFNNDGWEDLYLSVGGNPGERDNHVFLNNGDATFTDVSLGSGAADTGSSMGVAYADYDGDGRVDIVIGNRDEAYHLYRNISTVGNWLSVHLTGSAPINRDAVGALAVLELSDGRMLRRRVHIGSSIGADHQHALHFGLGTATPAQLTLTWPDGTVEVIDSPPINQSLWRTYPLQPMSFESGFE